VDRPVELWRAHQSLLSARTVCTGTFSRHASPSTPVSPSGTPPCLPTLFTPLTASELDRCNPQGGIETHVVDVNVHWCRPRNAAHEVACSLSAAILSSRRGTHTHIAQPNTTGKQQDEASIRLRQAIRKYKSTMVLAHSAARALFCAHHPLKATKPVSCLPYILLTRSLESLSRLPHTQIVYKSAEQYWGHIESLPACGGEVIGRAAAR